MTCASTDVDKRGSCWRHHQHWGEAINDGSVTNLSGILSPAISNAATCQRTGMTPAGANGVKRDARGHCHQGWSCGVGGRAIPQLSGGVQPPAVGNPVSSQCTDIIATHTYRSKGHASRHCHCNRDGAIGGRTVAELPKGIVSPTIDGATGRKPTGTVPTRGNRRKGNPNWHGNKLWCGAIISAAVAQLI